MPELSEEEFSIVYARNRAIAKIMGETRVGEVDGIHFDLRHKQINPDEWAMKDDLGAEGTPYPPRRRPTLPFIWFPWYGQFDLNQIKTDVLEEFRELKEYAKNGPPIPREAYGNITDAEYADVLKKEKKQRFIPTKSWIKEEIQSRTPDAIVNPGDSIEMHHAVMNLEDGDEFVPIQDRAFVHLFVKITNGNGLCNVLISPIVLYGYHTSVAIMQFTLYLAESERITRFPR
jgi:hypothetical protein